MTNKPLHQVDETPVTLPETVREQLADLAMRAAGFAQDNYVTLDNGQRVPDYVEGASWTSLGEAFENANGQLYKKGSNKVMPVFISKTIMPILGKANNDFDGDIGKVGQLMGGEIDQAFGEAQYSLLGVGTNAITILRRDKNNNVGLVRLTSGIVENVNDSKEIEGSASPLLISSFGKAIVCDMWAVSETESLAVMKLTEPEQKAYNEFQEALFYGTCFRSSFIKEIGVRADGTLMIFDPGEAVYQDSFYEFDEQAQNDWVEASLNIIRGRLAVMDVPSQLNPYAEDGVLKQKKARDGMELVA